MLPRTWQREKQNVSKTESGEMDVSRRVPSHTFAWCWKKVLVLQSECVSCNSLRYISKEKKKTLQQILKDGGGVYLFLFVLTRRFHITEQG